MTVYRLFLVTLIFLCLSHATLAVIRGTFASARLIDNRAIVFVEMKHGNNYAVCVCGNLIHRSFIITTYTPFRDPKFKKYNSYVRIGSLKSYEGGTVKRFDGHWPMKAIPKIGIDMLLALVRLNSPYDAPGDVDFGFVTYLESRPRALNHEDHSIRGEYVVSGFRHPSSTMVGHKLSYARVQDAMNDGFCKDYYEINDIFLRNPQTVNCYTAYDCGHACYNGMYTSQNDDGGGMYYRKTNILVGIAQTEVKNRSMTKLVPLIGLVENTWTIMIKNMWLHQKDEFDAYREYEGGTGLFD